MHFILKNEEEKDNRGKNKRYEDCFEEDDDEYF